MPGYLHFVRVQRQGQFSLPLLHVHLTGVRVHAHGDFRLRNAFANERVMRQLNCRYTRFALRESPFKRLGQPLQLKS